MYVHTLKVSILLLQMLTYLNQSPIDEHDHIFACENPIVIFELSNIGTNVGLNDSISSK